ncbi:iron ABC transporter substrate-binding protein [Bacillus sp. S10(2024)]|uniref:iron ABC transporter substrate-binding protein n=1 Tax=Bacillus sp. S10(2024) TaxID=3162886 RepID=UPI003D1B430E
MNPVLMVILIFMTCGFACLLWKIYKIKHIKKQVGKRIAMYRRTKRCLFMLFCPVYFIAQLILTYVKYINGEIDSFERFLLQAGVYAVTICFMSLLTIQLLKDIEVYEAGVVDGINYYPYEEVKGYKTFVQGQFPQENVFLDRGIEKWNNHVNLLIRNEDIKELEEVLQRYIPKIMGS